MDVIRRNQGTGMNQLYCMTSQTELCKTYAASTFVDATSLINYCSMQALPPELEKLYGYVQRVTSTKRADAFEDYLAKHLLNDIDVAGFVPPVTVALRRYQLTRNEDVLGFDLLQFKTVDTFLVDGLGRISTIMRIIGDYPNKISLRGAHFSAGNKRRIKVREKIKDLIRNKDLAVTFVLHAFKEEMSIGDIGQIFSDINFNQEKVQGQHAMRLSQADLLVNYARDIGELPVFEQFGGMSETKPSVTAKSKYIVTLSAIVRLIQGALGGAQLQVKNAQARQLPDGREIDSQLIDNHRLKINTFLTTWVDAQGDTFGQERNGYQTNSSLLQAMGLVYYSICKAHANKNDDELIEILKSSALTLSRLDYGRFGKHWENCQVMSMKKLGYSNNTGGGRTFREGLAAYLCSKIGLSGNQDMIN